MHWKSRSWILIGVLLAAFTAVHAQIATTTVADTIYHADGTPATGTALISWPAFTTAGGASIPTGNTSAVIAAGALSVQLVPNAGATPIGTYYTVIYHLDDGSVSRQYWVVPASATPVKIGAIESTVLPTSVAMQTVSKAYVDTAIATAVANSVAQPQDTSAYVLKSGDTMTGPLNLPADPVSATQAADKNYVDENTAALTGGLAQKVSTLPQATQVVTQPVGTQLDVNNLNAVQYASQYVTGRDNNGIANAAAGPDCANGCDIKAEHDYTDESYSTAALNNQTHIQDARGGRQADSYLNPLDVVGHGASTAQAIDDVSTQSELGIFQQTQNQDPTAIALSVSQKALAGGSNLFPEQIENPPYFKMGYSALSVTGSYNTQGQHVLVPEQTNCYGVGDCLMGSRFLYASGGFRDSADEGAHPFDLQSHEDSRVFTGTCAGGCTVGSTSVTIASTSGGGTQGDGRFLIDTDPANIIATGSIIGGTSNNPHAAAQFTGTNFPVSIFLSAGQAIPSQAADMAPGTVTISIATSGVPSGYATNTGAITAHTGLACLADQTNNYAPDDYEMAPYTVIDATHLQMTLLKPHPALATIAIGGLCGYGLEQTVDTAGGIRQLFPVVGSYSPTGLYYAGGTTAVVGAMNQTSAYLNLSASIASAVRSGNVVTITTAGNLLAEVNGLTVTIAGVADSTYNGSYVVTTTSANTFTYAQTGANGSSAGGTASVLTGGFALYPMAEVLSVFDAAAKSVDGQMTLAPNTVPWATNDPVEQPHFYQESVTADTEFVGQSVPRPTVQVRAGLQYQQNNGPGLTGWSIANAAPASNYLGYGGTHSFPDAAYESTGIWRRTMSLTAGEQAAFTIHCNLHGCGNWNSGYNLFELDSSVGGDTIAYSPSTSALSFNLRGGGPYIFTPQAFTAGTINVGTLNASSISGVPTLDANGRVIPGSSAYGGVLGNDSSPYGLGPAIFDNGNQIASFFQENNGQYTFLNLGAWSPGAYSSEVDFKGGNNCLWGSISMNAGDGGIFKNAGGCDVSMASLMLGINGQTIEDFEPDDHAKLHDNAGNTYGSPMTFTGGASSSNCGAGAAFDPGSNDGAGRIVIGSTPPSVCRVNWMRAYVNGPPGWAVSAPNCAVQNEGQRASAAITLTANPQNGDTVTIEGTYTLSFVTNVTANNQVLIGPAAAATATNLYNYLLANSSATPGNPPGVDPAVVHYLYFNPSSGMVRLVYNYLDGSTGNSATLATSAPSRISLPATLSGGTLPPTRTVAAQSGTGGMAISAPGGTLAAGDVLTYTCVAYW